VAGQDAVVDDTLAMSPLNRENRQTPGVFTRATSTSALSLPSLQGRAGALGLLLRTASTMMSTAESQKIRVAEDICVYTRTHTRVRVRVRTHTNRQTASGHIHKYADICVYVYVCECMYEDMYICIYICIYIYTCVFVYIYVYIHT